MILNLVNYLIDFVFEYIRQQHIKSNII